MANETYPGDRGMKPSLKHLAPPEAAETGTIRVLELPETYTCVWWSRLAIDRPVTTPAAPATSLGAWRA
jgi:hypothetical protein